MLGEAQVRALVGVLPTSGAHCHEHPMSADSRGRIARDRNVTTRIKCIEKRASNTIPDLLQRKCISVNLLNRRERVIQTARRGRTDSLDVPVEQLHAKRLRTKEEEKRPESVPRAP